MDSRAPKGSPPPVPAGPDVVIESEYEYELYGAEPDASLPPPPRFPPQPTRRPFPPLTILDREPPEEEEEDIPYLSAASRQRRAVPTVLPSPAGVLDVAASITTLPLAPQVAHHPRLSLRHPVPFQTPGSTLRPGLMSSPPSEARAGRAGLCVSQAAVSLAAVLLLTALLVASILFACKALRVAKRNS